MFNSCELGAVDVCIYVLVCVCVPIQVTLECPGSEESPRVDKLVERIFHCSCQSCSKEGSPDVMQLYPADNNLDSAPASSDSLSGVQSLPHSDTHSNTHIQLHSDHHHTLPHTSDGG